MTLPPHSQRLYAHMILLGVEFVGGDFNNAAKGIIADIFSDPEFMAPGSVPLWGAGGLVGDNEDCTGFLYTFDNKQLGLNERDESTHYPVFMHLWATHLPNGTRASLRSDAARARRALRASGKNERKRQRRLFQAAESNVDHVKIYRHSGKVTFCFAQAPANNLTHAPNIPRHFPMTCRRGLSSFFAQSGTSQQCVSSHQSLTPMRNSRIITCSILSCTLSRAAIQVPLESPDEELARIGLGCHFAFDFLCDNWHALFELPDLSHGEDPHD